MNRPKADLTNVSSGVVSLLCDRGMTLTEIARRIGVTKSYVSRVKAGTRSFTLEHLIKLERAVGEPLPWLLVKSIPLSSVPAELRPLYKETLRLIAPKASGKARHK